MSAPRDIAHRGIMLVVSSPSGAGKTTLTRNLLEQEHETVSLAAFISVPAWGWSNGTSSMSATARILKSWGIESRPPAKDHL